MRKIPVLAGLLVFLDGHIELPSPAEPLATIKTPNY